MTIIDNMAIKNMGFTFQLKNTWLHYLYKRS